MHNTLEYKFLFFAAAIVLLFFIALFVTYFALEQYSASAISAAAGLATVGWLVRLPYDHHLQKQRHTMDILLSMRGNAIFEQHRQNIRQKIDLTDIVSKEKAVEIETERRDRTTFAPGKYPLGDSIVFFLNYFEFISVACRYKALDQDIIKDSIGGQMQSFYKKFEECANLGIRDDAYCDLKRQMGEWDKK